MVRSHADAMKASKATTRNKVGTCQWQVRTWFDAPSAGDQDGDGDADANDGWLKEPKAARHYDRNWIPGSPLYFSGGSHGFGHRAMGLEGDAVRSTDMSGSRYSATTTSDTTIDAIERSMGVKYVGWSETIDGNIIPTDVKPTPPPAPPKPPAKKQNRVAKSMSLLKEALSKAKGRGDKPRAKEIRDAIKHHPED